MKAAMIETFPFPPNFKGKFTKEQNHIKTVS